MRERNEICTLYQRIYENQTEVGKKYYCYLQLNVMAIMRIKLHFKNKIQSMYVLFLFLPKLLSKKRKSLPKNATSLSKTKWNGISYGHIVQ